MTKDKPIVSRTKMPPYALRHLIQRFRVGAPITSEFESALEKNGIRGNDHYKSQKQHWLRWLGEYGGLGAYRRKPGDRSTKFVYNHIQCAPMLLSRGVWRARSDTQECEAGRPFGWSIFWFTVCSHT